MPNEGFISRLKTAWNVFRNPSDAQDRGDKGPGYSFPIYRSRPSLSSERSLATPIYTRISIDVAAIGMRHVRTDPDGRYLETLSTGLNRCLTLSANIDQTGRAFIQDVVISLCDEGHVAIVPVDTVNNPRLTGSYDILSIRTGKIIDWYPRHVRVEVYNDREGRKEQLVLPKTGVAILENPFYPVMNETNGTLRRLIRKLQQLDIVDDLTSSGKLDLIFQLPYTVKTEVRKQQAAERKKDVEEQMSNSKYGIVYTDATEKITQLNRPAENNLMAQVEYLTRMLYSQLGLDETIFLGTADEKVMIGYFNRTIEPFLSVIAEGIKRSFLTQTAISQGQTIRYYRDPFRLISAVDLANVADAMTRNEIMSSNDIRDVMGLKPSKEPTADELRNKNLNQPEPSPTDQQGVTDAGNV